MSNAPALTLTSEPTPLPAVATSRRSFIKTTSGLALGALGAIGTGTALSTASFDAFFATPANAAPADGTAASLKLDPAGKPYLIAVKNGSRAAMLDKALALLGGIERFVKPGQSVVIKPNIAWDRSPATSANTHPELVARLVELCLKAGAKIVNVFDHTCDNWEKTYKSSGVAAAVEKAGGRMVNGNDKKMYRKVAIPAGKRLTEDLVHELLLESDVFINVPVLKHHGGATMTAAMKNMMGAMWDRRYWHQNDLQQCIADYISNPKLRPALNIIDAYAPMLRFGPRGLPKNDDNIFYAKTLLASTDIVAIDAAAARILGHAEDGIPHVKIASDSGFGTCKLSTVKIERVVLS